MADPLSEIIALLRPGAPASKVVSASGAWRVRRAEVGKVFYCMLLTGSVSLDVGGHGPVCLDAGDFVLVPAAINFTMSSVDPPPPRPGQETQPQMQPDGSVRLGVQDGPADVEALVGYCTFGSPDADLLVALLPGLVVVRGEDRLRALTRLVADEARADRPARDVVLEHLLQVLLIEAMRSSTVTTTAPGLLKGLADERLAAVLRRMHGEPGRNWTVVELARAAGLSRSAFFARFSRTVGVPPMDYLIAWRMAIAKDLLRGGRRTVAEVAVAVGYGSASAFSTAFSREVGRSPGQYARDAARGSDPSPSAALPVASWS